MLVFDEMGKPENPEKKSSLSEGENQQQSQPTMGFAPGPHWWEVSAFTTAPPLLKCLIFHN